MTDYTRKQMLEMLGIDESFLVDLEGEEIIKGDAPADAEGDYSERMLERTRVAHNLVKDLDVNLPGVAIIVRMREEIAELRRQMAEILEELQQRNV